MLSYTGLQIIKYIVLSDYRCALALLETVLRLRCFLVRRLSVSANKCRHIKRKLALKAPPSA